MDKDNALCHWCSSLYSLEHILLNLIDIYINQSFNVTLMYLNEVEENKLHQCSVKTLNLSAFCACFSLYMFACFLFLVELSTSGTMQQLYTDSECSEDAGDNTTKRSSGELRSLHLIQTIVMSLTPLIICTT
jgi:hypothetical protein